MIRLCLTIAALLIVTLHFGCRENTAAPPRMGYDENLKSLLAKLDSLTWVAYAPTHFDPPSGRFPDAESIREDLVTLRDCRLRFRGLITYAADGTLAQIPGIARDLGFEGVIMGIWSPHSAVEWQAAIGAAAAVDGYCIGNEQLGVLYTLAELDSAIDSLREITQKPVTTTEEIGDYRGQDLLRLGDFLFPNAHPFWSGVQEPVAAADWTRQAYEDLSRRTIDRKVFFKEVGLPTAGAPETSEENQALYYERLAQTAVRFTYFEAFDQPWKTHHPVEPHWGVFFADRRPKKIVAD